MDKLFDYHLHSQFSADAETDINEIVKAAVTKGLSSICFTDHNDLDFPDTPEHIRFDLEIDDYIRAITKLKDENRSSLDIRVGVEQGLMPSTCEKLSSYSSEHPGLDFIICSSHVVDGMDPYYSECWKYPDGTFKDENALYTKYFEDMLYIVNHFNDYNVYGHMDYIFRYGPEGKDDFIKVSKDSFSEVYFPKYKDIIYEILKTIIENGKGIEINTGSLYRGMDYAHPHIDILKAYKELGGEILTIGSDAHDLEHIGYNTEQAIEIAKSVEFKYLTAFHQMQPEYINI